MGKIAEDILMHYGTKRHSGRYPWGSGDTPYQHSGDWLSRVEELEKQGLKGKELAEAMGMSTTDFRAYKAKAKYDRRSLLVEQANSLYSDGLGYTEIGRKMGINESTVRSLLNKSAEERMNVAQLNAEKLRKRIDEVGMIDVGEGVERDLGISKEKLKEALTILESEGYPIYGGGVAQVTNPGQQTILKIACPPGTEHKEIYNFDKVHFAVPSTLDEVDVGENSKHGFIFPANLDSSRLKIRYAEEDDGTGHKGVERDGLIEIRRGVEDLDLGKSHYAQVRIMVDDSLYLKGMAAYSDNLPDGVDVIFNTNKSAGTPMNKVLKPLKTTVDGEIDKDNPFGALIKEDGGQSYYADKNGKKKLSLINKTREEGEWEEWSKELPAQFLSKQNISLIHKQLNLAIADRQAELEEINSYTNPTIKKALLNTFASSCDSAAVELKAAALPRQCYHVILPIPSLKDNEIYAPTYKDGEKVALVRYPHAGTFEIPILTVNNSSKEARSMLGNAIDGVGINHKVAQRLSGADFDGDTAMVIPTRGNGRNLKVNITSTDPLKGLKDFEPAIYAIPEGNPQKVPVMKKGRQTGIEMGKISNLITDMQVIGATEDELARAVRHSMVVIDAAKHKYDYKRSEKDNGIAELKRKYQLTIDDNGREHTGAATLLSRAGAPVRIPKRKGSVTINEDGSLSYKIDDKEYNYVMNDKKTGEKIVIKKKRDMETQKMAITDDAYTLISKARSQQEIAYAEYANKLKAMANEARKTMINTQEIKYDSNAYKTYKKEVDHLEAQLNVALKNAPKERMAQMIASSTVKAKKQDYPDMDKKERKKIAQQALVKARLKVGAQRQTIDISDREWEAIQAGAVSPSKLKNILNHTDQAAIRERAMPRTSKALSTAEKARIQSMNNSGYTIAQIAEMLGKSKSTITNELKGKE